MFPVDENGIPGAMGDDRYFDGGDSAAIVGTVWACGGRTVSLGKFIGDMGNPVRHPDATKWYGKRNRFSRDQLIPMICAGIKLGQNPYIDFLYNDHKERWLLTAWNSVPNFTMDDTDTKFPDPCGPEIWALWIRYKKPWWAHAVLWLLDVYTLLGAIQWRLFPKNQLTRNHMLVSLAMRDNLPTVTGWLVNKINNWENLIALWTEHCYRSYEYDTSELFWRAVCRNTKDEYVITEQVYATRK